MSAKIAIIDIETRPIKAYCWGIWQQNIGINQIIEDWQILTYSFKWLGEKEVIWDSTEKDTDEKRILGTLWKLLDEADIVIAHNGDRFDIPKINVKMLKHGYGPYSPLKSIDTLKAIRSRFALTSNKLDFAAQFMGFGGKMATGGMQLWIDCMNGVPAAWKKMVKYNIKDVQILEKVYEEIRPWISNHPNLGVYGDQDVTICPKCGSTHLQYRGYSYTTAGVFKRFQCVSCKGWGRMAQNILTKDKRMRLARNVPK